jgi:lipopolysaccharide export LptBFGC system permease protein LptF
MESLETKDPDKRRLLEATQHHKRELEKEVRSLSDKTERILINGLIIGGSLAITYFIVSQWGGSKSKKKKAKAAEAAETESEEASTAPSVISQIGNKVINQASLILLDIAKEKILEYLESRKKRDENS